MNPITSMAILSITLIDLNNQENDKKYYEDLNKEDDNSLNFNQ